MAPTFSTVKTVAADAYMAVCSSDARQIRQADRSNRPRCRPRDDRIHVRAALDWLCRAHDAGTDNGVSAMFSMIQGWLGSYPETTGYIIPTFYDAACLLSNEQLRVRASEMAEWLLTCRLPDGSFPGSFVGRLSGPRVFNTGQIIFGLLRAARETGDDRPLEAAVRAGNWLVANQSDDGAWRKSTLNGVVHTYNVRSAWALVQLADATGESQYREAALANADWAAGQQGESGWFGNNSFARDGSVTKLHAIAYACRGFLEIGAATGSGRYIDAAAEAAVALHDIWQRNGTIGGAFNKDWSNPARWRCIPGEAQLAIVWMRLDHITGRTRFADSAVAILEKVKAAQLLDEKNADLHGGVSGALPINAPSERYCLVNWGPKFLIDALILKERLANECAD